MSKSRNSVPVSTNTRTGVKAKKKKKSRFKRRMPLIMIFLLLMAGVSIFMYPVVNNWYIQYQSNMEIDSYNNSIKNMSEETINKFEKAVAEYNKALAEKNQERISKLNYNDLLAISESIGYVEIPKIGVYLPIYKGLDDNILAKGVGHMEKTSLPIGGEGTHCVLAGHTGLPTAMLFTDLDKLTENDAFYIHILNKVLKYEVDQIKVVLPEEAQDIEIEPGKDYVTLLTCTPYGINSHRLLVRGERRAYELSSLVKDQPWMDVHKVQEYLSVEKLLWYSATVVVGFVVFVILIILLFPNVQNIKRKRAAKKAKRAEKAFERLIAEEARQIELEREAQKGVQLNGTQ